MNLSFFQLDTLTEVHNRDGIILYQDNYLDYHLEQITENIIWRNDLITLYGKTFPQPRLTAWHGDKGVSYTYSHIKMTAPGWTPLLLNIREQLQEKLNAPFNSVLINLYRNGEDHMSYHSDDEEELGANPTIASLSFGATRKFLLKHRYDQQEPTRSFELKHGSLLVMKNELQQFWAHKISKSTKVTEPRINLTFRYIYK